MGVLRLSRTLLVGVLRLSRTLLVGVLRLSRTLLVVFRPFLVRTVPGPAPANPISSIPSRVGKPLTILKCTMACRRHRIPFRRCQAGRRRVAFTGMDFV